MAYTTIDNPELYFQTELWTGNDGSNARTLDGSEDMQPDFVWLASRTRADNKRLQDSVRGAGKMLPSNGNGAEESLSEFASFDSDGFTINTTDAGYNSSSHTYCAWCWKAGGSASVNSNGSTNSSVSASTTAGFSVVSYTGAGATTYGHGLGATPNLIIIKKRTSDSGNNNWFVYHDEVITVGGSNKSFLTLNENGTLAANGSATTFTSVSSTTFGVGTDPIISESSHEFISYCFAEKKGYSKIGSWVGNGNADGTFIYTGFRPAYLIYKNTDTADNWFVHDNKRQGYNNQNELMFMDITQAESTVDRIDFHANGFKTTDSDKGVNKSGDVYVYYAVAEQPLVNSNGVPGNAR